MPDTDFRMLLTGCACLVLTLGCRTDALHTVLQQSGLLNGDHVPADIEILYIQVDRDGNGDPVFHPFHYSNHPEVTTSGCILPVALLVTEKIRDQEIPGLSLHARMRIDSVSPEHHPYLTEPRTSDGIPTLAYCLDQLLREEDAVNERRVLDFLTARPPDIHTGSWLCPREAQHEMTSASAVIIPGFSFYRHDTLVYEQAVQEVDQHLIDCRCVLADELRALQVLFFPQAYPEEVRFCFDPEDARDLFGLLVLPFDHATQTESIAADGSVRFGFARKSRGYHETVFYTANPVTGIEYLLAVRVSSEHAETLIPALAEQISDFESSRPRTHHADLSSLIRQVTSADARDSTNTIEF